MCIRDRPRTACSSWAGRRCGSQGRLARHLRGPLMQGVRLMIIDVDGTLLTPDKVLTARAARDLRKARVEVALTSGRPPRGLSMLIDPLALTTPLAAFDGGMFVNPD